MATISESIKLNDGVTPILKNMQQAMQITIGAFERMQRLSNSNMDMAELQVARQQLNEVGAAIRIAEEEQARLNATMRQMEAPNVTIPEIVPNAMPRAPTMPQLGIPNVAVPPISIPPVEIPPISMPEIAIPSIDIPQITIPPISLEVRGYEEVGNSINRVNANIQTLVTTQDRLNNTAQMMDFIPSSTQNKIQMADNSIKALMQSLEAVQMRQQNLSSSMSESDSSNAIKSINDLENRILVATRAQENLNEAMQSGDVDAINNSVEELTRNIDKAEKEVAKLNSQYQNYGSSILTPNIAIPSISVPPIEVPPIIVPGVAIPPIEMPEIAIPNIDIPQITMPPIMMNIQGYEEATNNVNSINANLERLVNTQTRINAQTQIMDFIPDSTQDRLQRADNSMRTLTQSLQNAQARQQQLNDTMGRIESRRAINSINRLDVRIQRARASQENLNAAMESGNLDAINRAANQLTRNINRAERETNRLNGAQQDHNRSLNTGTTKANGLLSTLKNMLGVYAGFAAGKGIFDGALEIDKMERTFQARLGDQEVGSALFEKLKQQAKDSAFSLEELANNTASFLAMTTDPKQIDGLNSLAEKLAMFDTTGQGLAGAGFSIKEAMSGDIVSLAERFNMSKSLIRALGIDELGKAGDIEGFVAQFEKLLDMQNMGEDAYAELLKAPETQLNMLKSNFKTAFSEAGLMSIQALQPLIDRLNTFMASDDFEGFLLNVSNGLTWLANGAIWAWDGLTQLWGALTNVYSVLEPYSDMIWGVVAAYAAFKTGMAIMNGLIVINKVATGLSAAAHWLYTTAVAVATTGQWGFNSALAACPIVWVIALIALLIGAIIAIALYIKKLWETNDQFAAGFMRMWNSILNFLDRVGIGFIEVFNGILNFMGGFKAGFLSILEGAINGAIGLINDFIGLLNNIPGVSIDVIGQVSFVAGAQAEEEAKKQSRADDIDSRLATYNEKVAEREQKVLDMLSDREAKKQAQEDAKANNWSVDKSNTFAWDNFAGEQLNMGEVDSVGEVGKVNDTVDVSSEDLKLMRELAEMTAVQNFVTLKPEVQVTTGDIRNDVDIDQVVKRIEETIEVEVAAHAKEVYNLG